MVKEHIDQLIFTFGEEAYVQVPNTIFKDLTNVISVTKNNISHCGFSYCYLVLNALLYKYAFFVDVDSMRYMQKKDFKQALGYRETTKSIDPIIKKGGLLDNSGLTATISNYPSITYMNDEKLGRNNMREYIGINELSDVRLKDIHNKIVRNKNFTVKEPLFLFERDDDLGTLYDYRNTHKIKASEIRYLLGSENLDNVDFYIYSYIKSQCGSNEYSELAVTKIVNEIGISRHCFYKHLASIEDKMVKVERGGWSDISYRMEINKYTTLQFT